MSTSNLIGLLERSDWRTHEVRQLKLALRVPGTWPAATSAHERLAILCPRPRDPGPGETLLVAVSPAASEASSLWHFGQAAPGSADPLGAEARECIAAACMLASHGLPYLARDVRSGPVAGSWSAKCIWSDDPNVAPVLDGGSIGLAVRVAVASWWMARPIPADVLFSATTTGSDGVGPVAGSTLEGKVRSVARNALGVRRIVVHESQAETCRTMTASHGRALEVVGIRNVAEAYRTVWPNVYEAAPGEFDDPDIAEELARHLYGAALWNRGQVLDWTCVRRSAGWLLAKHGHRATLSAHARFAESVAARHTALREVSPRLRADVLPIPSDDDLAALFLSERLRLLAHIVQSHIGGGAPDALEVAARFGHLVGNSRDCESEGLALRGAVGRVYGALAPEKAVGWLEDTVEAWLASAEPQEVSRPWCELVRVLGVLAQEDLTAVGRLERQLDRMESLGALLPPDGRVHMWLAAGRACIQAGMAARGLDFLADQRVAWDCVIQELRDIRLRWMARAEASRGGKTQAAELRECVETGWVRGLTDLDRALEGECADDEVDRALALTEAQFCGLVALLRLHGPSARPAFGRWFSDRFPF